MLTCGSRSSYVDMPVTKCAPDLYIMELLERTSQCSFLLQWVGLCNQTESRRDGAHGRGVTSLMFTFGWWKISTIWLIWISVWLHVRTVSHTVSWEAQWYQCSRNTMYSAYWSIYMCIYQLYEGTTGQPTPTSPYFFCLSIILQWRAQFVNLNLALLHMQLPRISGWSMKGPRLSEWNEWIHQLRSDCYCTCTVLGEGSVQRSCFCL